MRQFVNTARALGDPARVRALLALRSGELCLCHLIALLRLAPATVSRHLTVLHRAGLVERRRQGRWCYFRLAGRAARATVRGALRWLEAALGDGPEARTDAARLRRLRAADVRKLTRCYKGP